MIQLKELKQDVIIILDHQDNTVEIDRERFEAWCGLYNESEQADYWHERCINDTQFKQDIELYLWAANLKSQEGLS